MTAVPPDRYVANPTPVLRAGKDEYLLVQPYEVQQETRMIRGQHPTMLAVLARPFTDDHGHEHVWVIDPSDEYRATITTGVRVRIHHDCDGTCGGVCQGEGYSTPAWRCLDCGDVLDPPYATGPTDVPYDAEVTLTLRVYGYITAPIERAVIVVGPHQTEVPATLFPGEVTFANGSETETDLRAGWHELIRTRTYVRAGE